MLSILLKIRKRDYIAYDLGDLCRHLDVWSVKLCIIHVSVLYIFSIKNLMEETVLIKKKERERKEMSNVIQLLALMSLM